MSASVRNIYFWIAVAAAILITLTMRFTVYGDDCNLFVVGMTFLFFFIAIYGAIILVDRVRSR